MNSEQFFWTLILLGVCAVLMGMPFWSTWSEWRHPQDHQAMSVDDGKTAQSGPDFLQLAPGARFDCLQAERIVLGDGRPSPAPVMKMSPLLRWQPPSGARPWGVNGWHIPHDLHVPAGHLVPCSLVVRGRFTLDGPGRIEGDIKTQGRLHIGAGSQVLGNLFSEEDIRLDADSRVAGVVMAEGHMQLAPHVVIGSSRLPVSVCADMIDVEGPVQVHGTLQARINGQIRQAQPQLVAAATS